MGKSALEWFRADQRASGLSVRRYEHLHGIFLSAPGTSRPMGWLADISQHEFALSPNAENIGSAPALAPRKTVGDPLAAGAYVGRHAQQVHCRSCEKRLTIEDHTVK